MMLSGGGEGESDKSRRGAGLLVPFCSTWKIWKCLVNSNKLVWWPRGGAQRVNSKSKVTCGDRRSLVTILGGRRTKAIEKKIVKAVWGKR